MQTPIYLAAVGGHQEVLKMLISQGGDINAKDSLQKTALHRYLLLNRPLPLIPIYNDYPKAEYSVLAINYKEVNVITGNVGLETILKIPSLTGIQLDCFVLSK